jgi:hypothetical protein
MLKIISSPPFDDYSKRLFYQVFGKKKELGLSDASFIYLWTGPLSNPSSFVYSNGRLAVNSPHSLPKFADFIRFRVDMVAGKKKYMNTRDDMYALYCEYVRVSSTDELYSIFCSHYAQYIENILDRSMIEDMIQEACVNDTVVLFIKDHFRISTSTSWTTPMPELSTYFNNLFDYYPNKRFIVVTSLENLDREINKPNCTIIPMGGDVTNQLSLYMQHTPSVEKHNDAKNFISLNRGSRFHRTYLVSALYGRNLDSYGNISHLSFPDNTILSDAITYDYNADVNYDLVNHGFNRYSQVRPTKLEDSVNIYDIPNDNLTNFKESLQHKYTNSLIEFVSETSYNEHSFNITEKTLHFIYGANFPIMISSPGTVHFLRNMGIDMFDDVVDHSYDSIEDPAARINSAIDLNNDILTSTNMIDRWKENKYRIDKNISFVKEGKLRDFYSNRFWNTLKEL